MRQVLHSIMHGEEEVIAQIIRQVFGYAAFCEFCVIVLAEVMRQREKQALFGAEMIIEHGQLGVRGIADRANARSLVPMLQEQLKGDFQKFRRFSAILYVFHRIRSRFRRFCVGMVCSENTDLDRSDRMKSSQLIDRLIYIIHVKSMEVNDSNIAYAVVIVSIGGLYQGGLGMRRNP